MIVSTTTVLSHFVPVWFKIASIESARINAEEPNPPKTKIYTNGIDGKFDVSALLTGHRFELDQSVSHRDLQIFESQVVGDRSYPTIPPLRIRRGTFW